MGGAFFALAQKFLIQGGVVYGVSNVELKNVQTIRIDSIKDLELLLKSKYVQSNCIDSFPLVKEDLMSGRRVLYSGTACVVQGLKNYLEKKNVPLHSLFTCDLICHGVPSRLIDRDYQLYIENKCKKDIISITYRDKELGWGSHFEKYVLSNGKTIYRNDKVIVFSKGYALSPACFQCKYTNPYRVSDITIGDFWGLDRVGMSKKQFKHGISICIVRSSYIENIFLESTKNKDIELSEIELKDAMQWNLEQPTSMPKDYERFWMMYKKNRFKSLKPVYFSLSFKEKLSRMVKCIKNNIISKGKK